MRIQTTWIVIFGTLIACAGFVIGIIGFFGEKNSTWGVIGAVIAVAAIVGTVVLYRRSASVGRPQFEAAIKADFAADDWGWYDGAGIAIDRTRRLVLLGTAEGTRRVPFDQIGGVTYHATRTSPTYGSNSILALITLPMAIAAMVHNANTAGMHVTVSGQPTRLAGIKPGDADRWQRHLAAVKTV